MARRPTRIQGFTYRGCHRYFVTTCTLQRVAHFSKPEDAGELAARIPPIFEEHSFDVLAYCVMPDHVHILLEGMSDDADFRNAVRVWKLRTGYAWRMKHQTALWQIGYWERVLREKDDARAVIRYMLENPVRAGLVARFTDYEWSGSARFTLAELAEHAGGWDPPWKTSTRQGQV
jgi:REP-associated tyrosine transposase